MLNPKISQIMALKRKERNNLRDSGSLKICKYTNGCKGLLENKWQRVRKMQLTKKETMTITFGTINIWLTETSKLSELLLSLKSNLKLILDSQKQITLRKRVQLIFVFIMQEVHAQKVWIASIITEFLKQKTLIRLVKIISEMYSVEQGMQLIKRICKGLVLSTKSVEHCLFHASSSTLKTLEQKALWHLTMQCQSEILCVFCMRTSLS